jgi:DUF1680 family protein
MTSTDGETRHFAKRDIDPVSLSSVDLTDEFWKPRIRQIQQQTLPDLLDVAEADGKIDNFRIVAGRADGTIALHNCPDSDVYKLIEAAADTFHYRSDPALEARIDDIVEAVAAAQADDGYLNTQFMLPFEHPASPDRDDDHVQNFGYGPAYQWRARASEWPAGIGQLYCAGHLFEAAVAHYRATGDRSLLEVAIDNADHIDRQFPDPAALDDFADHPEIGIGLLRLYEVTGEERYRTLADRLVSHVDWSRPPDIGDGETALPLRAQREAFGHCVRSMYVYAAGTDLAASQDDMEMLKAMDSLWHSVVDRKMYVHGGIGNGTDAEQHGHAYDLPTEEAYAETCASIGMGMWNHRLNLLTGDSKYVDVLELATYNSALAGLSLDGRHYFYRNRLAAPEATREQRDDQNRRRRYLFCCPSNLPRFVPGIGRWQYGTAGEDIAVNLYATGRADVETTAQHVTMQQETQYPWEGRVDLTVTPEQAGTFAVNLRIPGWCRGNPVPGNLYRYIDDVSTPAWTVTVNDEPVETTGLSQGYRSIRREWHPGDRIALELSMPVRRLRSHPAVDATEGKLALMRGPLVYCVEDVDHEADVFDLSVPNSPEFAVEHREDLLEGVTVIRSAAVLEDGGTTELTAVPYYAWDNRSAGKMRVWIPEHDA